MDGMEPIRDLSWMAQLALGALERFELNGWAVAAVGAVHGGGGGLQGSKGSSRGGSTYRFRLLFSEPGDRRPVYAINLESSILGGWVISEQEGATHRILDRLPMPLAYEEFRIRALERALTRLGRRESETNSENNAQDFLADIR
jgi:hypothetical protein